MKKHYFQSKKAIKNEMFFVDQKVKTSSILRNLVWLFLIVIGSSNSISYSQTIGADCASAPTLIVNTQYTALTNITDATVNDPTEAACNTQTISRDGWIKFVAVGTEAIVRATSTNRNPILYGYTGVCGTLSNICSNVTTSAGGHTETLTFTGLIDGNTYYVRIGNSTTNNMTLSSFIILSNDQCSNALTLTSNTSCVNTSGSTLGATDNNEVGDCTNGAENAVWYQFQAVATSHVVTVDGIAGFNAVLGVISNCGSATTPTGGSCINATNDDGIETLTLTGLTIGTFYKIQVYDFNGDLTANGFTICVTHTFTPTITSFTPSSGCASTATVVITGTNFTGATAVTIGGTAVTSFVVNSATQITAVVGNGTTGTIAVTTSGGTATSAATFTVNPLPANPGNPTSNSPQCLPSVVTITRNGSVPVGETWYWQTVSGGTATTDSGATYAASTSGTYYIRAQNNTTGCWSLGQGSVTIAITALPANPGNPTSNSPQCSSPGVTITRSGSIPAGETWYWQTVTGGTSTTSSAATYVVTTSGTYYIRARNNTSLCWCSGE